MVLVTPFKRVLWRAVVERQRGERELGQIGWQCERVLKVVVDRWLGLLENRSGECRYFDGGDALLVEVVVDRRVG
jgi:hypothetical protein